MLYNPHVPIIEHRESFPKDLFFINPIRFVIPPPDPKNRFDGTHLNLKWALKENTQRQFPRPGPDSDPPPSSPPDPDNP